MKVYLLGAGGHAKVLLSTLLEAKILVDGYLTMTRKSGEANSLALRCLVP